MKIRKILLSLLTVFLLAGLAVQAFAQSPGEVPAAMLAEPAGSPSGYVPGSHTGAELTWEPYVEDLKRSPTTYTTTKDAIAYLQDRAINRRDDVIVDLKISYSKRVTEAYLENLWYTILDGALAHDPSNPVAGDYLAAHIRNVEGKISANVSGSYVLIKYTYSFDYLSTWAQENTLTNNIKKLMPKLGLEGKEDYEQVQAIYDYITENVKYDYEGLENENDIRKFTAYGALVEKSAVCQGYASLFYRLCLEAGIDARLIVGVGTDGTTQIPHAWNIVKVGDYYYNVDATWDAELRQAGYEYAFFLRCERVFAGHIRDASMDTAAFHRAYPMGGFDFVPGVLESGFCGDAVVYFLLPDYSVTIVGEGPTYDYSDSFSTPWGQYRLMITDVTIEAGVTKIGDYLFAECVNLRSIQIPESVTAIGKYAFDSCEYLKQTHIPATVATFGEGAFKGCAGFTEFTLPKTMDHIPAYLFFGCTNLETLELSGGIGQIGDYAFCGCKALSQLPLPEGLQTIGRGAFEGCVSIEQATLPQSVKTIGVGAFRDCAYLSEIRFPDAITSLPDEILIGCKSLTQVTIPDRVTKIGSSAFRGCASLEEVIIPNTVTKIGGYLFGGCADLKNVVLPDNFTELPDGLFWGCSALEAFTISDKITTLGERVFSECTSLKTMTIPNSVVSIGESLFDGCTALESVKLPVRLKSIPTRTFSGCKGLKYFEIPFRVTEVGENAFSSSGLVELTIPGNVEKICDHAFSYCESLETLIFEDGLTGIGEYAFRYCTSLKNIHFSNTITGIGYMAFWGCSALEQVTLPATVTYVSASFGLCDNLEKLIVQGDGVILTTGVCSYCPKMNTVIFTGNPPDMEDFDLRGIGDAGDNLVLYYPANNPAWTQEFIDSNSQYYTWKPYYPDCDHVNTWSPNQKEATCTEAGYSGDLHCRDCGQVVEAGQVIAALGHSDTMDHREPSCTQLGGDVYTCGNCGREYVDNPQELLPHSYENGVCTVCGGVDESFGKKFSLAGSNMTLGNKLDMNFFVNQSDIDRTGHYALIVKDYADGSQKEVEVPQAEWKTLGSLYYFTFTGVKAKEMADKIEVVICDEAGEPVSESYTDSVQEYSRRMLSKSGTAAKDKSLYVEMLNYGAAAQTEFGYDTGNLANSVITAQEQTDYGMADRVYTDQSQRDNVCKGVNLTLENQILFNVFFDGSAVTDGAYAVASYVNHNGKQVEEKVTDFAVLSTYQYASFKSLVVADCSVPVTVTLYDRDGNVISTVIDSVESYAARMSEKSPLYDAVMRFADAAYQYFHGCKHNWSDWVVSREPTLTEPGLEQRLCANCDAVQSREVPVLEIMTQAQAQEARDNGTLKSNPVTGYEFSQITGNWYSSNYPNYKDFYADGVLKVAYVSKFAGAWFTPKVNALGETMDYLGAEFLFINANSSEEAWMMGIENVIAQDFDVVVLTPVNSRQLPEAIAMLREAGIAYMTTDDGGQDGYGFHAPHYGLDDYSLHYQLGQYVGQKIQKENWLADVDGDWGNFRMVMLDSPAVQAIHLRNQGFLDGINTVVQIPGDKVLWIDCGGCLTDEVYAAAKKVVGANQDTVDKWLFSSGGASAIVAVTSVIEEYGIDPENVKVADTISTTEPLELMGNSNFAGSLYGSCLISKFSGEEIGRCIIALIDKETPLPGFTNYPFLPADETNYSQRLEEMQS